MVPAGPPGVPLPRVARVGSQAVDARAAFQHRRRFRSERVSAKSTRQRKGSFILQPKRKLVFSSIFAAA